MPTSCPSPVPGLVLLLALAAPAAAQQAGAPLSAIDWLSDTVAPPPVADPSPLQPGVSPPGAPEVIATTILSDRNLDRVGTIPALQAGFDRRIWAATRLEDIARLLASDQPEPVPALRVALKTLLQAEVDPPQDVGGDGAFLLMRVDKLLELGALDAAAALIEAAGPPTPELFRRAFDIALLLGTEDAACAEQRRTPAIAPTFMARVFCLARGGDWQAAELTFRTGEALAQLTPEEEALLARFLDPAEFEDDAPLPPPERLTPLVLRMYEAIGEALPSGNLPLAFAHGDLTPVTGWKARLEAGERLARAGAIPPERLFALYTERRAAASGGVWTRVRAVARFEAALATGGGEAVSQALVDLWAAMAEAELEVAFAAVHAEALQALDLAPEAAAIAFRAGLLIPGYEARAGAHAPADADEGFLAGIARGRIEGPVPPDRLARAIAPAFAPPGAQAALPDAMEALLREGRAGEAMLLAIERIMRGASGDLRQVTEGLATLRRLGLEDVARRTALQLLILERRG